MPSAGTGSRFPSPRRFANGLNASRVALLASVEVAFLEGEAPGIHAISRALARHSGLDSGHGVMQVDRLLSNAGIDVWNPFACSCPFPMANRQAIVAIYQDDLDADDQFISALATVAPA